MGSWGLRIRYTYTTDGSCAAPQIAQWPATGWSPLTVLPATPAIQLRNANDTADIPKLATFVWVMSTGQTARAYAFLDGLRDVNPPSGLSWSYRRSGSITETPIGTA